MDISSYDILVSDKEFCECISKKTPATGSTVTNNYKEQRISSSIKRHNQLLQQQQNGMLMHAAIISNDNFDAIPLVKHYKQGYLFKTMPAKIANAQTALEHKFKKSANDRIDPITAPTFDSKLITEQNLAYPYCVPMREFLAFKQYPNENDFSSFYKDLRSENSYSDDNWNFDKLKNKYISISNNSKSRTAADNFFEASEIQGKLEFLHRNPLYKNLFLSNDPRARAHKEELWSKIKNNLTSCLPESPSCLQDLNGNGALENLRKEANNFFKKEEVLELTTEVGEKELSRTLENITNSVENDKPPRSQKNIEDLVTSGKGMGCDGTNGSNSERCLSNIQSYCKIIPEALAELPNAWSDLESEWADDFETEPAKNKDYTDFNKLACNALRIAKDDPAGLAGKKVDFWAFKRERCSSPSVQVYCNDPKTLWSTFMGDYPVAYSTEKNSMEVDFQEKILTNYTSFSKGLPSIKISKAELTDINNYHESRAGVISSLGQSLASADLKRTSSADIGSSTAVPLSLNSPEAAVASVLNNSIAQDKAENSSTTFGFQPSAFGVVPGITAPPSSVEAQRRITEIDSEKESLRSQIQDAQAKLAIASENEKRMREERVRELEQKELDLQAELSQLRQSIDAQSDQKVTRLIESDMKDDSAAKPSTPILFPENQQNSLPLASDSAGDPESDIQRSPSSLNESVMNSSSIPQTTSATGGVGAFIPSSANAVGNKLSASLNYVLLAKYGIATQGPTDAVLIVNPEADAAQLSRVNAASTKNSDLPLSVSHEVYSGFENRDEAVIKQYEKIINSMSSPVVKLSIKSPGKQTLEFYAIREQGKLVFQPVRKVTRNGLLETLSQ